MTLVLDPAAMPADAPALEALMAEYLAFLVARVPEARPGIEAKYDPARLPALVRDWARLHAPPTGALLIARRGGAVLGCGMMRHLAGEAAEIQRLFVRPEARGLGVGRALTLALMDRARADGRAVVRLDTGRALTEAIALYRALGFREIPPYHDETPQLAPVLIYLERPL